MTVHQKTPIGRLSAFCGAVSAGCGAAAGVAWLCEGSVDAVSATITNTLGMITERYLRLCVGLSFNERWFQKWKVQ